jgi:putative tryptophan/tyrosine transport system substrate-binding protein
MGQRHALVLAGAVTAALVGGCGMTAPVPTPADEVPYVGLFHVGTDHVPASHWTLLESLEQLGYVDGETIRLDFRNLEDDRAALTAANDFVANGADLIVAYENQTVRASKATTAEVPVLFLHVTDPVKEGYVESLSNPGGNLTGVVHFRDSIEKQLELFTEVVPSLERLLVLIDPHDPAASEEMEEVVETAERLGLELVRREATTREDLDEVFGALDPGAVDGVFLASPNLQTNHSQAVIDHSLELDLAFAGHRRDWTEKGALFSYGADYPQVGERAARYVQAILDGSDPAELPVEQISELELVINLTTARALELEVPESLLERADALVE